MSPRGSLDISERENCLADTGIRTTVHPASTLVAIPTALSQRLYKHLKRKRKGTFWDRWYTGRDLNRLISLQIVGI